MYENVDLVINCTPTDMHYKTTSVALSAGKDVLVEKPSTLHWKQDRKLKELAKHCGNLCAVDYPEQFNPVIMYMKQTIRPIDIHLALIMRYGPMPAHRKGDLSTNADLGSHDVNYMNSWVGKEPQVIDATENQHRGAMRLRYNNLEAFIHAERRPKSAYRHRTVVLYGTNNYWKLDLASQKVIKGGPSEGGPIDTSVYTRLPWAHQLKVSENTEEHISTERQEPLEQFLITLEKSIRRREIIKPLPSIAESMTTTKVIETACRIAERNKSKK